MQGVEHADITEALSEKFASGSFAFFKGLVPPQHFDNARHLAQNGGTRALP